MLAIGSADVFDCEGERARIETTENRHKKVLRTRKKGRRHHPKTTYGDDAVGADDRFELLHDFVLQLEILKHLLDRAIV